MAQEQSAHHVNYFAVFGALCILTALSWLADEAKEHSIIENAAVVAVIVLAVATAKALFVMAYFMHLKFEGRWKFILLAPTIILAIGLPLALLPDIGLHYYTLAVPQSGETMRTHDGGESHDAPHDKENGPPSNPH